MPNGLNQNGKSEGLPYSNLPDYAFWHKAVAGVPPFAVDPLIDVPFRIAETDAIATAGSCFAQHISRSLQAMGFHYLVAEEAPESMSPAERTMRNYGTFSARYGNIYTARQFVQLFDRAYGRFQPHLSHYRMSPDKFVDPFRPRIQPGGFPSVKALEADRQTHFACVRRLFEQLDVLVFTLGLTESWECKDDGAILPLPPGVAGGEWFPDRYTFRNLSYGEVLEDLLAFVDRLRDVNRDCRVVLTVSPVPLMATYEPRHVLVSTCLSKSILRVAAASCCEARPNVAYFPAYEIITGPHSGGAYYEDDLRSVTDLGVGHVMRVFFRHYLKDDPRPPSPGPRSAYSGRELETLQTIVCDEEALTPKPDVAYGAAAQPGPGGPTAKGQGA